MKFDMTSCGGCRTCEMACSFHHRQVFSPAISSIKILDKTNEPGFFVLIFEENDGDKIGCDGCEGLDMPLCVEYCKEKEALQEIISELKKQKSSLLAKR
jgi:Fe-S-cluster-containing hydrogenase component 2